MFVHALETCPIVIMGFVTLTVYFWDVVSCIVGTFLIDNYGTTSVFIFFGFVSLLGLIYMKLFVKETSYKLVYDDNYEKFPAFATLRKKNLSKIEK
jgi:hypothetical protein